MKKLLRFFMLAVLFLPFALHAQTMYLTVADSTATNGFVPVYGNYMDDPLGCQSIYPAEMLTSMVGENILSLHYYASSGNSTSWGTKPMLVKLMIVTESDLSAGYIDVTNATTVYNGTISAGDATVENGFTVDFTTPFMYTGGNLLVSFQINPNDEGGYTAISWYGKVLNAASRSGYGSTNYDFTASGTVRNFLPKTTFMYGTAPTCFKVTGQTIDNAQTTANSLTLTWTDAINTTATYSIYNMSDTSLVASGITGTTYTVNNLSANTAYSFGIQTDCGGGDIANGYAIASGRTACAAISNLPFNEDFETVPSGSYQMPYCWNRYTSAFTTTVTYPYSYASNPHGGSRSLYFFGTTGATYPDTMVAILPELDVTLYPMSNNRVTFWAKMGAASNNKKVYVGTMTDPADMTTFVLVDSVSVSGNTYTKFSVPMVNATGAYVALVVFKGTGTMYIDDVTLEEMPSCLEITGLSVSGATSSSVTLSWTDDINPGASYTIYDMSDTSVVATASSLTQTIDNLTPNTTYTFGVQANCAAGDAPMVTVNATTTCAPEGLPFSEDFSASLASDQCWRGATGTTADEVLAGSTLTLTANNQWTYSSTESNGLAAGHYRVNIYGTSCKRWMITPEIDLSSVSSPLLTFDAAFTVYTVGSSGPATGFESNTSQAFMILVSTNNGQTWTTAANIGLSTIASATYLPQFVDLSAYAGQTVRVAFYAQSTTSGGDNNLHIDNIQIEESTGELCMPVADLAAGNITANSATLTWTSDAGNYSVYDMSDTTLVATVSANTYTINNLTGNTTYTYGVQANCSTSNSPIVSINVHTDCEVFTAPHTWDFEAMATNATPECWTKVGSGTVNVLSSTDNSHGGSQYVRFSGSTSNLVVLPEVQGDLSTLQVRFWTRPESYTNSNCGTFSVGYMTDASDATTFVEVVNYTHSDFSAYEEKTVTFAGAPTGARMAMRHNAASTSWFWYIDDVTIEEAPACLPVSGLTASNITSDAATLTWTSDAGSYNVYDMSDTSLVATVSTASHDLTNLNAMTQYTFGVAANCGSEVSPIVTVTLTTACAAVNVPFTETFETTSGTANCWTVDGNGSWSIGTGDYSSATGAFEGSLNALITHGTTGNVTKLISPILDNVDNGMILDFAYVIRDWSGDADELRVYSRSAAESAWQQLAAYTTATGAWTVESVIIPGTVYQIAFEYTDNYGYGLGIDSVVFTAMTGSFCYPVSNLTVTNTTSSSVSLSWSDENNSGASYTIYDMSDNSVVATNVSGTSYDVTGLTAMTGYTFGVAANCSATETSNITTVTAATACAGETCSITISGNDSYGDGWNGNAINLMQGGAVVGTFTLTDGSSYSETFTVCSSVPVSFSWVSGQYPGETSFTILDGGNSSVFTGSGSDMTSGTVFFTLNDACPSCLPATALTVDAATETSITISWTGTAASYDVYNGLTFVANVTTNSYTFTGLTSATSYVFGVQALCSATDSASVAIITATTECSTAAINLPYHETFSLTSSTRNCWTSIDADNDGFGWTTLTDYTGAEQEALLSYSYYNGTTTALTPDNWAISPKLHSTAGSTVTMQWTVASAPSYPAEHYGVYVSTTTPDITSFTMVDEWTITNGSAEVKVLDLSTYAGQDIYVAFRHHNCTDQYVLKIDDVQLYEGAFTPDTLNVTFAVNNPVMGTTIPAPGTYQYVTGDTVHFTAIANSGYHFVGWEWATSVGVDTLGSNYISASLTLSAAVVSYGNMTFTALFEAGLPDSTTVTYTVNDPTMGTIYPAPGTYTIYVGDSISAMANPNAGYVLSAWTLDYVMSGSIIQSDTIFAGEQDFANPIYFGTLPQTLADYNVSLIVTAVFEAGSTPSNDTLLLNLAVSNPALGSITPAPGTYYLTLSDTLVITATPNPNANFDGWGMYLNGQAVGTLPAAMNPYPFVVNQNLLSVGDVTIVAIFSDSTTAPDSMTLVINTADATMGTTNPAPGTYQYAVGSTVTISAVPNPGYSFLYWIETVSAAGLTMSDTVIVQSADLTVPQMYANMTLSLTAYFQVGEPCPTPTGVSVTAFDAESITLGWDDDANVSSWNIRYSTQGGDWTTVVANTNSYTISGLAQNTTYTMQVQANCGDGNLSDWSAPVTQTTTGLNNYLENSVVLFPNPAREYVDIRMDGDVNVKSMDVYDVYGKLINTVNVIENPTRINVSGLANGMYFVRVTTEQGIVTKSFIKK